jgi:hypothetical protein
MTQEGLSFLTSLGFLKQSDLGCVYWKTSKEFFLTTTETLSKLSSLRLLNWGTTSNGKCSTQRISESRRIGKESSLSDILEQDVPKRFFLSDKVVKKLLAYNARQEVNDRGFRAEFHKEGMVMGALKVGGTMANDLVQVNDPVHSAHRVYDPKGVSPTVNTSQGGGRQPFVMLDGGAV